MFTSFSKAKERKIHNPSSPKAVTTITNEREEKSQRKGFLQVASPLLTILLIFQPGRHVRPLQKVLYLLEVQQLKQSLPNSILGLVHMT